MSHAAVLIFFVVQAAFLAAVIVIIFRLRPCKPARGIFGHISISGQGASAMTFSIAKGVTKTATVVFSDAADVTQPIYSVPVWAVTPPDALTLTPAADGMTCSLVGVTEEPCTLTAVAEGDPTAGVNTITATLGGTVTPAENTKGTITVA
jgi:hypothetical protein